MAAARLPLRAGTAPLRGLPSARGLTHHGTVILEDDRTLLTDHARRVEELVAGGAEPMDLRISSEHSAGALPVTVCIEPDPLPDGTGRLELFGSILPTWGDEPPEVEPGVELRLVQGQDVVARQPVREGTGLFTVFEAHALNVLGRIAEGHLEQQSAGTATR